MNKESNFQSIPILVRQKIFRPPAAALAALSVVALWGCLFIYTARAYGESPMFFMERQLIWLVVGVCAFFASSLLPFPFYRKASGWLYGASCLLLAGVLIWGKRVNGMTGWFEIFDGVSLQPSEFTKFALLLFLSSLAADEDKRSFLHFVKMFSATLLCTLLVLIEPDFGSAALLFAGFLIVYFVSGGAIRYLLFSGGLAAGAAAVFLLIKPYAWKRLTDFFSGAPDVWHLKQFQYALARGGLIGSDGGTALWSNAYLPLPHTDSLYATIVESSGMLGGLIVLGLFVLFALFFTGMSRKNDLPETASIYIFSVGMLYFAQALVHISVNVLLLPTTGITLPVLSYGGSSLVSIMIALGIAFSASRAER